MSAILLYNPKYPHNVGQAIRAASCFGIEKLYIWGDRVELEGNKAKGYRLPREERMHGRYDVELIKTNRPFDLEKNSVPVAIELVPGAQSLPWFLHPEHGQVMYVFGPEDGSLPPVVLRHCHQFVSLPMAHCANLASAVYITLYDRHMKAVLDGVEMPMNLKAEERVP